MGAAGAGLPGAGLPGAGGFAVVAGGAVVAVGAPLLGVLPEPAGDGPTEASVAGEAAADADGLAANDGAEVGRGWGDWAAVAAGDGEGRGVTGG